jgi:bifunctional non-homologous end joining protein LigD
VIAPPPRPMLASSVPKLPQAAAFDRVFTADWLLEEKLDGHRCIIRVREAEVHAWSRPQPGRGGVALSRALPAEMVAVMRGLPTGDYDGELVASTGKAWDVNRTREKAHLIFVAFDLLRVADYDLLPLAYETRRGTLLEALRRLPPDQTRVSTVESVTPTWAAVQAIWARGGEGAIVKRRSSTYQPGARSGDWVKVKTVHNATLTIIGFEAGKNGPYSALQLRDSKGVETTVKTPDRATLERITLAPTAFVGREVVISFQERTPSGTYRHGRFDHFAGPAEVLDFFQPATARTRR